jgi:two-component system sensor histidine kinase BaeS
MISRARWLRSLETRFLIAFLAVALSALSVLAVLVLWAARADVSTLVRDEQDQAVETIADVAAAAYRETGDWTQADLEGVMTLAAEHDTTVSVHDAAGRRVTLSANRGQRGRDVTRPVVVDGARVGAVRVTFSSSGLTSPQGHLRDALTRQVAVAVGLAALVAIVAAALLSRRVTRPVVAVADTARAVARGDRTARVGSITAPGELGELAAAFDRMTETIEHEESLRRALLADVAHELRTPLTVMQMTLEAMADRVVEPTPGELSALRDDVLRLERVVSDLEALAHAEAASVHLETASVDLADVALSAVDRLRPQLAAAGLDLDVQVSHAEVEGDRQRLHQVVTNLLTNALKFTTEGSVRVLVAGDRDHACVEVSDTGIGITPDDLPHIFDRFWRGERGRERAGSGLGLTIVAELVEAHGGTVSVDSVVDHGTTVVVCLPRA